MDKQKRAPSQRAEFAEFSLGHGIDLHVHQSRVFKTTRVDIFIQNRLQPGQNTRLALISRLLERGTQQLPDMRSLNQYIDEMYGAAFGVEVDQLGDRQLIHLYFEVIEERFTRSKENILAKGIEFIADVLTRPVLEGKGFREDYLEQEKKALKTNIDSIYNDKMALANRRCVEQMCAGESFGLSVLGQTEDLMDIDAVELFDFFQQLLANRPVDIFLSGSTPTDQLVQLAATLCRWPRSDRLEHWPQNPQIPPRPVRQIVEIAEVNQGKLVLGYRTATTMADPLYPALLLFNCMLGDDAHSRLFRRIREEEGLCYYISSNLESLCGLMFIEAGIESNDFSAVKGQIKAEIKALQRGHFTVAELESGRTLLMKRLRALGDNREALVRYHFQQKIAGRMESPHYFAERLRQVTSADLIAAALGVRLDTVYFLRDDPSATSVVE